MMCCVNKTMPIHFIDGKCHIKQGKAMKLVLPIRHGLYHTISQHWLLMPLRVDTHILMHIY